MDRLLDRPGRPSCLHKAKSTSSKNKTITSLDDRFTSKVYTSPNKPTKGHSYQLLAENDKLRRENEILQEYFETFEERYREQRKENETLKKQLKEIRKGKEVRSPEKKSEVTHCLSERTLVQKMGKAAKSNKVNPLA
jgi:hypothetical protein